MKLNVPVIWVDRGGTKLLAQDYGSSVDIHKLQLQIAMSSCPAKSRTAAQHMLFVRFGIRSHPRHSLSVIRGKEGSEVRKAYSQLALQYGVEWSGRRYDQPWDEASPVNRAISVVNACLYGLTEIAISLAGFSPHLGAIHRTKRRAFVYDIADMEKLGTVTPLAFRAVATGSDRPEWVARAWCVELFREGWLLPRLFHHAEATINASTLSPATSPCHRR